MSITTDSGSNMVAGIKRNLNALIHIRCAGHVFDNAIFDGLRVKEIEISTEKIRFYCSKIHRSSIYCQQLEFQCVSSQEPAIQVVMDVNTRWNSTYSILATALRIKKSLTAMSLSISTQLKKDEYTEPINADDWVIVGIVTEL